MLLLNQLEDKERFTSVEREIISYILEHKKDVLDLTADELANKTYTSTASIVRLCKKLGFKGYKTFKVKLATEINSFNIRGERIREDIPFQKDDSSKETLDKLLNLSYQSLTDTYNNINEKDILEVVNIILKYDNLSIFANGPSCLIAADFYYKVMRLGMNVHMDIINGFSYGRSILKNKNTLAMFISYYGKSRQHLEVAQMLKNQGVDIILITGPTENPLCRFAKKVIYTSVSEPYVNKIGTFSSRVGMQFILDYIFSLIFIADYDKNINLIEEREKLGKIK